MANGLGKATDLSKAAVTGSAMAGHGSDINAVAQPLHGKHAFLMDQVIVNWALPVLQTILVLQD